MEHNRFDALTRLFASSTPRRALFGIALAPGLSPLVAQAKKGKKKRKKKNKDKKDKDTCKPRCNGGTLCCDGRCVSVVTDPGNCGSCGNACPAGMFCANAQCVPCEAPRALCTVAGEQRCVDLQNDRENCGACGNRCYTDTTPQRNYVCQAGQCICTGNVCPGGRCCPAGYSVCNASGGCCPDGFKHCPGNSQGQECCPVTATCGGSCGQACCQP